MCDFFFSNAIFVLVTTVITIKELFIRVTYYFFFKNCKKKGFEKEFVRLAPQPARLPLNGMECMFEPTA